MSDALPVGVEAAASAWLYAAIILTVGTSAARFWVRLGNHAGLSEATVAELEAKFGALGLLLAILVVLALIARMWAHTFATFGWADSFSWSGLEVVALDSRWGSAWRIQIAVAALFVAAMLWIRIDKTGWLLAALACVGLCFTLPLVGHAAGSTTRVMLHGTHVMGAGLWLGTLAVLFLVLGRSRRRFGATPARTVAEMLLGAFSPVALSGVATLAVTGAITAYSYVGALSNLWTTLYGRVLATKVLLFLGAGICGWLNRRRYSRDGLARERAHSDGHLEFSVGLEVGFAVAIVVVTGLLTQLRQP
jgi:copper transport protein